MFTGCFCAEIWGIATRGGGALFGLVGGFASLDRLLGSRHVFALFWWDLGQWSASTWLWELISAAAGVWGSQFQQSPRGTGVTYITELGEGQSSWLPQSQLESCLIYSACVLISPPVLGAGWHANMWHSRFTMGRFVGTDGAERRHRVVMQKLFWLVFATSQLL